MFNFRSHSYELGCVVDDRIFFSLSQKGDLYCDGINVDEIPIKKNKYSLWLVSDKLIVDDKYGRLRIYDCATRELIFKNDPADVELYIGGSVKLYAENVISVLKVNGVAEKDSLLNLSDCKITDSDFEFQSYHNNLLFSKFSIGSEVDAIRAYDKTSKVEVWEYSDFHEYESGPLAVKEKRMESANKILGVAQGLLWIQLSSARIVGLDLETGKCFRDLNKVEIDSSDYRIKNQDFSIANTAWPIFVPEESKILFLLYGEYSEIDLNNEKPVLVCYATGNSFREAGVDCSGRMIAHGNMIYFCDGMSTKVGAFDRDKKELVWHDNLKNYHEKAGMPAKIMATDSHLYFQDNNNNLFIFEKVKGE
jgi:hypothetical protein